MRYKPAVPEHRIENGVTKIEAERDLYKKMYYSLFSAAADAVDLLEKGRNQEARNRLIQAQRDTEEMYMSGNNS